MGPPTKAPEHEISCPASLLKSVRLPPNTNGPIVGDIQWLKEGDPFRITDEGKVRARNSDVPCRRVARCCECGQRTQEQREREWSQMHVPPANDAAQAGRGRRAQHVTETESRPCLEQPG